MASEPGTTMLAARWHGRRDVRVEEVPIPQPRPDQVLVAVEWCGICGTDLEEYREGPVSIPQGTVHPLTGKSAPLALGHEIVGRVARPAEDGSGPAEGAAVIPDVVLGCGECWWCRRHEEGLCAKGAVVGLHTDGGLSEYVVARASSCVVVPDGLGLDVAALAEPTSVAVRALRKVASPIGSSLLVLGAGTIGLLVMQVARTSGFGTVIAVDPQESRLELALRLGADHALNPQEAGPLAETLTRGLGPDVVAECTGIRGQGRNASRLVRRGGTVLLVGIHGRDEPLDLLDAVLGEKRILGSAAHLWDEDVLTAVDLLARGRVDGRPLLTNQVGLTEVDRGFGVLEDPASGALKVLVHPRR